MLPHHQLLEEREMKRWGLIVVVGMSAAFSMFGVAGASAATEFGNPCAGNQITSSTPNTFFPFAAMGDPLPLAVPGTGVITKWTMSSVVPATFQQTLKVVRKTGPETVLIVGESTGTISLGKTSFETRIPVQAGDFLGVYGTSEKFEGETIGNLFCELTGTGEVPIGALLGAGGGPGTSSEFLLIEAEAGFPVTALLEPDADNDGYGDETQDKCPTSATTHEACPAAAPVPPVPAVPAVSLSTSVTTKKGLAKIFVTSSIQSSVTVAGKVKIGAGKTAKLNGGTQLVSPGTLATFTLLFPKVLKEKLKALSNKQSLTLKVTASAPNSAGVVTTKTLSAKLRGQGKSTSAKGHHHKR
jgi:hypothetical protein